MSKVYPLSAPGSFSDASSGEPPKQANELVARELVIRVR